MRTSITMLSTSNHGSVKGSFTGDGASLADCLGNRFCKTFNKAIAAADTALQHPKPQGCVALEVHRSPKCYADKALFQEQ